MNYFNPYYMSYPAMNVAPKTGILRGLFGNINFSSILSGTSKTLNVVNQAIPLVKQAGPIMKNAKTMFRVMNEFKKVETPSTNSTFKEETKTVTNEQIEKPPVQTSGPTFFL